MNKKLITLITFLTAVIAIATAVTGILLYLDKKKKEDEEIQQYIDCAIQ